MSLLEEHADVLVIRVDNDAPPQVMEGDDPVSRYFKVSGIEVETAYLGESEFELGMRVRWRTADVVYRFDAGKLLICDLSAAGAPEAATAMRDFVNLVRTLERHVPDVFTVHGLVPVDKGQATADEAVLWARLLTVYQQLGATCEADDSGMVAVTYPMRAHAGTRMLTR